HTRFSRDWSSDVCSSDLAAGVGEGGRDRVDAVDEERVRPPLDWRTRGIGALRPARPRKRLPRHAPLISAAGKGDNGRGGRRDPRSEERRVGEGGGWVTRR